MYYQHSNTSAESSIDLDDDRHDCPDDALPLLAPKSQLIPAPAHWSPLRPFPPNDHLLLPPAPQGPISSLPQELLIHILRHLHLPRDIFHCLLVCRQWCQCSVELLWHKPVFTKYETLSKMIRLLASPNQSFTYPLFIRRLNFLSLGKALDDSAFAIVAQCRRLERLTLVNCDMLSAEALVRVLPSFPNLVAVDLSGVGNTTDAAIAGLASSARRLQGINLAGCKLVSDQGLLALAKYCPLLRRVKLSGLSQVTDAPISALANECPLLLEIDLNKCSLITDISIRDIWSHSAHMREMRLSHCAELSDTAFPSAIIHDSHHQNNTYNRDPANQFPPPSASTTAAARSTLLPDDALPPLTIPTNFEHLRMLDLTACALVTDDAIEGIISRAPKIRNLVLSKCSLLTDRAVDNICKLGRHLHILHLGHASRITDRSVRNLARSCTRLRYVDFANCTLLTDMSVFELSGLTKLRRIGLVRVNRLTDESIYSLARRHNTLERIHLSYCDQISVMAIHFLLQKLHKLTHLSLTGVQAFRQQELQQFCREPPKDFNEQQQAAFCVYSGKGVVQLRNFLSDLFDHITENTGTVDTEFDEDDTDPEPEDVDGLGHFVPMAPIQDARHSSGRSATPRHFALHQSDRVNSSDEALLPVPGRSTPSLNPRRPRQQMLTHALPVIEPSYSPSPVEPGPSYSPPQEGSRSGSTSSLTAPPPQDVDRHRSHLRLQRDGSRRPVPRPKADLVDPDSSRPSAAPHLSLPITEQHEPETSSSVTQWPYEETSSAVIPPVAHELLQTAAANAQVPLGPKPHHSRRNIRNTISNAFFGHGHGHSSQQHLAGPSSSGFHQAVRR